jgi:catechol 2,3-dioxygenase-like lactoylglutathione lyase family enzyme
MPKFRHLAIVCQDPARLAEWYQRAFDFVPVHHNPNNGVTVLSDGEFSLTLLHADWVNHNTSHPWHFGVEMPLEEIAARRERIEALGAPYHDGVRDGREVEVYVEDPEGHRIDLAPHWITQAGTERRQEEYQTWEPVPAERP